MPRALRLQDAGYLHHVVARGNDRQTLFRSPGDFHTYLEFLHEARTLYPIKVYNFCLMDNHIHLLVEPSEDGSLSKAMEHVSKAYAKYFNKTYSHVGHVWQGRFKSFLVQTERYFFTCSRYIDLNPVKANLINEPKGYEWSGYSNLAHGKTGAFKIDHHDLYKDLGSKPKDRQLIYKGLVMNYQGAELDLLNRRAGILGDKEFKRRFRIK